MQKWEKFLQNSDAEREKSILHDLSVERQIIKTLEQTLRYDVGQDKIEPENELVSYGAIYRCYTCLESILLIRNGYIGSANALLRQVYELLSWAKLALDAEDDSFLQELHNSFYINNTEKHNDGLGDFLKKAEYIIEDASLDKEMIKKEGKEIMSTYSCSVHGRSLCQQRPYKSDDFYAEMDGMIKETSVWIACFIEVMEDYLSRCAVKGSVRIEDAGMQNMREEDTRIMCINVLLENIFNQRIKTEKFFPLSYNTVIYKVFAYTKWRATQ